MSIIDEVVRPAASWLERIHNEQMRRWSLLHTPAGVGPLSAEDLERFANAEVYIYRGLPLPAETIYEIEHTRASGNSRQRRRARRKAFACVLKEQSRHSKQGRT